MMRLRSLGLRVLDTERSAATDKRAEARVSGTCWTADPVTNRRSQLVIDSVAGSRGPDHDALERLTGQWEPKQLAGDAPIISEDERAKIAAEALEAERLAGEPLDLEWLIDRNGELYWLNARPTTGLGIGGQSLAAAERFIAAIAAIDLANGEDPNEMAFMGEEHPKERLQSERASVWVRQLSAEPSEALQLAARAHHLRRWQWPRSEYPTGREGYHAWRRSLAVRHADGAAEILARAGYGESLIDRVGEIIQKKNRVRDPEVQVFEDALCLVFLETQLADFADKHLEEKVVDVILRSLQKMSEEGRHTASKVELGARERELLARAVQRFR